MHVSCVRTITIVIAFYGMVCWGVGVCQNPSSTHQHETLPIITIEWVVELQVDDMI